jgi:uncharacterized protein DUF4038/uncharacterized protein DUF5060
MSKHYSVFVLIAVTLSFFGFTGKVQEIPQYGLFEVSFESNNASPFQFPKVSFLLPDGDIIEVDGFYDGGKMYKARAYCKQPGLWKWEVNKAPGFFNMAGKFKVIGSTLKGKLKKHPDDQYQFAYDNNDWFLHIGDTGYRYLTESEKKWKEYIDQAVMIGISKIRTWFCSSRSNVEALFDEGRNKLNLSYWQEIDKRIAYALEQYPNVVLQLIPFGEDSDELKRYMSGDSISYKMLRYAQSRFSAYPNVIWCISNDREIVNNDVSLTGMRISRQIIEKIGSDMASREPWTTMITNHQTRFMGYSFVDESWSDIITLEDLDQIDGRLIAQYRSDGSDPVVNDEDRYEMYRAPEYPQYYFRRLMWASLLSGGHATYGGAHTYMPYEKDSLKGVQGYFDVKLKGGDSFKYISKFFIESGLTLVNMLPDDRLTGNKPQQFKCIHNNSAYIIYLANPDKIGKPEIKGDKSIEISSAKESSNIPSVAVNLPGYPFSVKWYDPSTGIWSESGTINGGLSDMKSPGPGDWILLLTKN